MTIFVLAADADNGGRRTTPTDGNGRRSERGLNISVAGYDDVSIASHPSVSLTTVAQPGEAMGSRATELLLERIGGRTEAVHETYVPGLRIRNSTRAPNSDKIGNRLASRGPKQRVSSCPRGCEPHQSLGRP